MAAIILAAVEYWWRSKLTNWRILMWQLITLWWWERESRRPAATSSFSTWKARVPVICLTVMLSALSWTSYLLAFIPLLLPPAIKNTSGWKGIGQRRQCQPPADLPRSKYWQPLHVSSVVFSAHPWNTDFHHDICWAPSKRPAAAQFLWRCCGSVCSFVQRNHAQIKTDQVSQGK